MQRMILMLLTTALAGGPCAAATEPPSPAGAIHELVLRRGVSDTRDLRLLLRAEGGKFAAGVATGFNGPVTVDCSGLALAGEAITGRVKVVIGWDGYFPPDGKALTGEYRVTAKVSGGALSGKYEGTVGAARAVAGEVAGAVSACPLLRGYWVMDLQMENGAGNGTLGPKSYGNRVYPRLFLKDGRWVQSLIYGWGQRVQINYFESAVAANDLAFDGKTLSGSLSVQPTGEAPGTAGGRRFVFTFDGTAVGAQVSGTFKKRVGGEEAPGGSFHGSLQPLPARPLDQCVYYLELHGAVQRTWQDGNAPTAGLQLMAFAPRAGGKFGAGVAYAAAWNHAFHDLDPRGLTVDGNSLGGTLKAMMHPDPYMPPDHKPVPAAYAIAAKIIDGRIIQGKYTGTFKDRSVSGAVFGELLDQPAVPEPVAINVKMEEGVNGGAPWHRRTWVNFTAVHGRADRGGMSNNKNGWKGTFKRAEIKFDGSAFTATVDGTVDESSGAEKGAYTFKLTGRAVGSQIIGAVDTYREGKLTKSGTDFMGGFGPAQPPGAAKAD